MKTWSKSLMAFLCLFCVDTAKAQIPDSLLNKMSEFDLAILNGDAYTAVNLGTSLLRDTAQLPARNRIVFFAKLGKAYEDTNQDEKAIFYDEKVAAAEPRYFVTQRALGYLYVNRAKAIQRKLFLAQRGSAAYAVLQKSYREAVLKAVPLLEKAQACDPDEETLDMIRTLYLNINDQQMLDTLPKRLQALGKNCIDLLAQ